MVLAQRMLRLQRDLMRTICLVRAEDYFRLSAQPTGVADNAPVGLALLFGAPSSLKRAISRPL
jgi:hypothetical protein